MAELRKNSRDTSIAPDESMELTGTVERITFRNDENGYTVARFKIEPFGNTTITGIFASINSGEHLTLYGTWVEHQKFGRQFEARSYHMSVPATLSGMEKYLASGLIPGIGPKYAKKIIDHFGPDVFEIIESEPGRIVEVPGIGKKKAQGIIDAFHSQKSIRRLMMWLQENDVSPNLAIKIYKEYGEDAIRVLKDNPYKLADDIFGVGFKIADSIARKLGMAETDPKRYRAGIRYLLREASNDGHIYLPENELNNIAEELLQADYQSLGDAVRYLITDDVLIKDDDRIYLKPLFNYEEQIAIRLARLARGHSKASDESEIRSLLEKLQSVDKLDLSEEQFNAVIRTWRHQCVVITGGPGTGKSTTVRLIVRMFEKLGKPVRLTSPTGRAAKRLEEACDRPASTIHRLLEFHPQKGFQRNEEVPLDTKVVIVDESSMIDVPLMYFLLRALPSGCRLVLVGDVDQLPSVGPGCVLRDIINSGVVEVVQLTQIFRQAAGSSIVTNAHRINRGQKLAFDPAARNDFKFTRIEREKEDEDKSLVPTRIADHIISLISRKLSKKLDPFNDIQVLTPMHAGPSGARELNRRLQETINPQDIRRQEIRMGDRVYREGDRVMQIKNNYDLEVFNGDIGRISAINRKDDAVRVMFDREVTYKKSDLDELQLAYAITVHKSQGSEYPCVVMPVTTSHWIMLQRNLLYTAITRAKKFCFLIGQQDAVKRCIYNAETGVRYTNLMERLRKASRDL